MTGWEARAPMRSFVQNARQAVALALVTMVITTCAAVADDWIAVKLRGNVFAFHQGDWHRLERGSVVPDNRVIRTLRGGRVTFKRDAETIEIGGATQISIIDRAGKNTTVDQHYGDVEIDAERRNVQHFAVETPHLAAVVKGTRFRVESDDNGAEVEVERGEVEVTDTRRDIKVTIRAGQSAATGGSEPLSVNGDGPRAPITTLDGDPVAPQSAENEANALDGGGSDTLLGNTVSGVGDTVSRTVDSTADTVNSVSSSADKTVDGVTDTVSKTVSKTTDTVSETVSKTTDTVSDTVSTTTDTVSGVVGGLLGG